MRVILREEGTDYKPNTVAISQPSDILKVAGEVVNSTTEVIAVLYLNSKNFLLSCEIVASGSVNSCACHVAEVFRSAIIRNSAAIILLHVHPSGDPTPSIPDRELTDQVIKGGKVLNIIVHDHIIVAPPDKLYSMREQGDCAF